MGVRNQAQSPVRFVMDPYEQLHAFDWIDSNGLDLVGMQNDADTADYEVGGRKVELYCELEGIKTGTKVKTLAEGPFVLHQSIAGVGVGEEVTP